MSRVVRRRTGMSPQRIAVVRAPWSVSGLVGLRMVRVSWERR